VKLHKFFFSTGAISAGIAVIAGAFGAHMLEGALSADALDTYSTAVRYQMYHSLGLLAIAWALTRWQSKYARISGWLFIGGILIFSGSLYILSLTGISWFGAITPLGGLAFIVGWALLTLSAIRTNRPGEDHSDNS